MGKQKKEITAVIIPPKSEHAKQQFQKKMSDFYAAQVEKRLLSLPKEQKLQIIDALITSNIR